MRSSRSATLTIMARASVLAIACGTIVAAPAAAQEAGATTTTSFNVPAGPLSTALAQLGEQAGVSLVYPAELAQGRTTAGVNGKMDVREALARLLAGTGLTFRASGPRTVVIEAIASADGERVLGAVRVEGAQSVGSTLAGSTPVNGVNGSRDVTATEGTGSYTSNALTVGSKTAQSIKDTSMAVSVLTQQRMQDQNITDFNSVMRNLPGVTIAQNAGSATNLNYYSRGFTITQFAIDGGVPMITQANANIGATAPRPIIDMSLYDHVELVRGATGTFTGYGDPGGVINLVRKKPLDHQQFLFDLQLGSWKLHRVSVDVTGPLAFDGALRARVIATHQDNNFFYDVADYNLNLVSGSLEYDLTPTTLVSAGFSYQDKHEIPFSAGLMRYLNGQPLGLPRSTCLCFNFAYSNVENTEIYGSIEQRIGSRWTLKGKATRFRVTGASETPTIGGPINPYTLTGAAAYPSSPAIQKSTQMMLEATLDGSFRLFGQDQKLIAGVNYTKWDRSGTTTYSSYDIYTGLIPSFLYKSDQSVNVFDYNADEWLESGAWQIGRRNIQSYARVINAYANMQITPFRRLHVDLAVRYSKTEQTSLIQAVCDVYSFQDLDFNPGCVGKVIGDYFFSRFGGKGARYRGSDLSWPPSVQWRYDLTDNLAFSAIYTDIYVDQSLYLDRNKNPLPPQKGMNIEGAVKWLSPDKKLNASMSGYYIKKKNVGVVGDCGIAGAPACENSTRNLGQLGDVTSCCYTFDPARRDISYGVDIELSGEVRRGWQITASYNYNRNYQKGNGVTFDGKLPPLVSYAPRHKAQIWTTYAFTDGSSFSGFVLGAGILAQSKTFVVDSYCKEFYTGPEDPFRNCKPGQQVQVNFSDPGHAVVSASVGYKLDPHLRIDVQIDNLLNKTYYDTVGGVNSDNFYGAPRSFKATLRGKW